MGYYKQLVSEGKASVEELVQLRQFVRTSLYHSEICNGDTGHDEIKDILAKGAADANLLRMAITNYYVEHNPFNMPMGGFYMIKNDVKQVALNYLAEEMGLGIETVSACLAEHFDQ